MEVRVRLIGNVKILVFSGTIDRYSVSTARQYLEDALAEQPANLVVNLMGVRSMDSSGLSALIQAKKRAREQFGDLRLCGLRAPLRTIFELTRLDKVFEILNSEGDAVQTFTILS